MAAEEDSSSRRRFTVAQDLLLLKEAHNKNPYGSENEQAAWEKNILGISNG